MAPEGNAPERWCQSKAAARGRVDRDMPENAQQSRPICLCATGLSEHSRQQVRRIAELFGIPYRGDMRRNETTHLLVPDEGIDAACKGNDKVRRALQWGISILRAEWLTRSAECGRIVPEESFQVARRHLWRVGDEGCATTEGKGLSASSEALPPSLANAPPSECSPAHSNAHQREPLQEVTNHLAHEHQQEGEKGWGDKQFRCIDYGRCFETGGRGRRRATYKEFEWKGVHVKQGDGVLLLPGKEDELLLVARLEEAYEANGPRLAVRWYERQGGGEVAETTARQRGIPVEALEGRAEIVRARSRREASKSLGRAIRTGELGDTVFFCFRRRTKRGNLEELPL